MSDGESIAGREREVTFHTSGALTPHFFTEFDEEARSRESRDPFYHDAVRLVEEYRAALNTITQQAQELEQAKGSYAIQKAAADDYEQQLAASQARCREMEANQRRTPTENETVCYACDGSGWVDR